MLGCDHLVAVRPRAEAADRGDDGNICVNRQENIKSNIHIFVAKHMCSKTNDLDLS